MKSPHLLLTILWLALVCCVNCLGPVKETGDQHSLYIEQNVNPGELFNQMVNNPDLVENNNGEPFAWNACNGADMFNKGYRAWHDTSWLNNAVKYYRFLLDHMTPIPDGNLGLIGRNFRSDWWSNEQVSDALAVNPMLEFSELVRSDPELNALYGDQADEYVAFAKKHVIEKWDKRALWHEEGEYGDYIFGSDFIGPDNPAKWIMNDTWDHPGMSQKFNIVNKLGVTNLRLYRITKDEFYRDKAEKLFFRMKSDFQYFDDHYVWHYWIPFYEGDILFEKNDLIHWTAVHPYRAGYQASEVSQIIEAYHTGVVFSKTDIQRIINTNMEVMWNRDTVHPAFINSNGAIPDASGMEDFLAKHKSGNKLKNQGTLWTALIDFDDRVRLLYEKEIEKPESIKGKIRKGHNSTIITKAGVSGQLEIALFDKESTNKLTTLYKGEITGDPDGHKGFQMIRRDGIDPVNAEDYEGDYIIRWTFRDGYRDHAIKIVEPD